MVLAACCDRSERVAANQSSKLQKQPILPQLVLLSGKTIKQFRVNGSIRKLAEYYNTDPLELLSVAYPDKYAQKQENEQPVGDGPSIRVEDLLGNNSVLTYNGVPLAAGTKSLVAAFIAGLIIAQPE